MERRSARDTRKKKKREEASNRCLLQLMVSILHPMRVGSEQ